MSTNDMKRKEDFPIVRSFGETADNLSLDTLLGTNGPALDESCATNNPTDLLPVGPASFS